MGAVAADKSGALAEIAVGEQRFGLDPHRGGIGDMSCRVGHSELCRLDREVLKLGPVGVKAIEIATIENAKRDQRCRPWPFGGSSWIRTPRKSIASGATHSGSYSARSASVIAPPSRAAAAAIASATAPR